MSSFIYTLIQLEYEPFGNIYTICLTSNFVAHRFYNFNISQHKNHILLIPKAHILLIHDITFYNFSRYLYEGLEPEMNSETQMYDTNLTDIKYFNALILYI